MAALVQSYPQSTSTVTMVQPRPSSAGMLASSSQGSGGAQYLQGVPQMHRNSFHGMPGNAAAQLPYRPSSSAPIQPYAFTSTPSLANPAPWQHQYGPARTSSSPAAPTLQSFGPGSSGANRQRHFLNASTTSLPQSSMGFSKGGSRDDSSLPPSTRTVPTAPRPQSSYMAGSSTQLTLAHAQAVPPKASPDRYRRPAARSGEPNANSTSQLQGHGPSTASSSTAAGVGHYNARGLDQRTNVPRSQAPVLRARPHSFYGSVPVSAVDDIHVYRQQSQEDAARRFRRRSMHTLDSADYPKPLSPQEFKAAATTSLLKDAPLSLSASDKEAPLAGRARQEEAGVALSVATTDEVPVSTPNASSQSLESSKSSSSSRPSSATGRNSPAPTPAADAARANLAGEKQNLASEDYPRLVSIPPRNSSADVSKRPTNPSPLSQPVTMASESGSDDNELSSPVSSVRPSSPAHPPSSSHSTRGANVESPAVRQLAAINQKGAKLKSKTSRLRRAFSFGSSAELRKASNPESAANGGSEVAGSVKAGGDPNTDGLDEESVRVAKQQEAAGIGSSIYSHSKGFSGSTDDLSISSTASSASIMIRKMGRGLKRGSRSLVGLFRPKSVIGVPAAGGPVDEPAKTAVSMITAEAEREGVKVNADPPAQTGGGADSPHLELNSLESSAMKADEVIAASERGSSSGTDTSTPPPPRKSIVGGDKERAEVLATIRKGILKKPSDSSSGSSQPSDARAASVGLPNVPSITDSPNSSAPSTPNEENQGHKRTGSVAISNEDYFVTAMRLRRDSKSAPPAGSPQGVTKRSASFSPRIVFYDTWPSQEYDRRGDIATCNRLTPMLAQQIKEELNNFKMEMEVHENSKIYTHFF